PTPLTALSTLLEPIVEALLVVLLLAVALQGHLLPASVALGPVSPTSLLLVLLWLGGGLLLDRLPTSPPWPGRTPPGAARPPGPARDRRPRPARAGGHPGGAPRLRGRRGRDPRGRGRPRAHQQRPRRPVGAHRRGLRRHRPGRRHRPAGGQHRPARRPPGAGG